MARFTGLLFALALSKRLLFQVKEQDRCSSLGISDCEYSVFMGVCDGLRKPKVSLDITKQAPFSQQLFGNTRYGRLNLAFLCEGRTHGGGP